MRPIVAAAAVAIFVLGVDRHAIAEPESRHGVVVHIDSPEPVELRRLTGDKRNPFYVVCTSPCDEAIPTDAEYRISGDSVRSSRRFVLPEHALRDVIVVKPASSMVFQVGIVLISVGTLSSAIGLLVTLASAFAENPDGASSDGRTVGLALVGGGLAAAISGIVVAVVNGKTNVRQTGEATSRVVAPPVFPASACSAALRRDGIEAPMWNVPLVSAVF
jgi:hypothetical protein